MTRYIKSFQNAEAIQEAVNNEELLKPYVAYNETTATIDYNTKINYTKEPLTFEIISGGTICWKANNSAYTVTLEYSKNGGEWTEITSNTGTSAPTITVESGDTVQFRGNNATLATSGSRYNTFSGTTCTANLSGNIMSLLKKDNFSTADTLQSAYTFNGLFQYCKRLRDASNLVLPATTLATGCYSYMFYGCTSLTTVPELPATTLALNCYSQMFEGCTLLTTAPELPATTLARNCYYRMFSNTNVLPDCSNIDFTSATVVASGGLQGLFSGTKVTDNDLRQILPINHSTNNYYLPATTLANSCYYGMFSGCTGLTTAPELPASTLAINCYQRMFQYCEKLTTAPELPATTLAYGCYRDMFNGCTNLNHIECLATDISASDCLTNWVSGVASTGTFVKDASMTSWTEGTSGIPTGWTVEEN